MVDTVEEEINLFKCSIPLDLFSIQIWGIARSDLIKTFINILAYTCFLYIFLCFSWMKKKIIDYPCLSTISNMNNIHNYSSQNNNNKQVLRCSLSDCIVINSTWQQAIHGWHFIWQTDFYESENHKPLFPLS